MGNEIGASGEASVGLLLLQHQRELVREGKAERNVAHSLAIQAKKISNIYDAMDENAKKFEKFMDKVELVMDVIEGIGKAQGLKADIQTANKIAKLPDAEAAIEMNKIMEAKANPPDPKGWKENLKFWGPEAIKQGHSIASPAYADEDKKNKDTAKELNRVEESALVTSEKARDLMQKEQELANEAFKIGDAISRLG